METPGDHDTFKPQIHDYGRGRTEKILQAEEQILESVEELYSGYG